MALEWLKELFRPAPCAGCIMAKATVAALSESAREQRETLKYQIADLKGQRDKLQDALFRVARVSPPSFPAQDNSYTVDSPGKAGQFKGSKRNWNDVRSELERKSRRISPEDEEKQKAWQDVNNRAEQEIPELANILAQRNVVDKTDVEILAE